MEKVYGLRNIDHTSYQRTYQGFNETTNSTNGFAQSQGIILHKVEEKWEVAGNYFIGNPYDSANFQQKGFSGMGEYEVGEQKRLGASVFSAKSEILKKEMAAIHYRQAVAKGSALMFEWGLIQNQPSSTDAKTTGSYNLLQALISLTRGYNLKATVERYNPEFKSSSPDQWKWSAGLLMFPLPRVEIRTDITTERQLSSETSNSDSWEIMEQIHVSL
jgi:hypothetical protein